MFEVHLQALYTASITSQAPLPHYYLFFSFLTYF